MNSNRISSHERLLDKFSNSVFASVFDKISILKNPLKTAVSIVTQATAATWTHCQSDHSGTKRNH